MAEFENLGLKAGVWSGLLHRAAEPEQVSLVHHGEVVAEARVTLVKDGLWRIDADVPGARISDGATSFLLLEGSMGGQLASLSVVAGQALDQDVLVEMELLRAELDLLKREFRRFAAGAQG